MELQLDTNKFADFRHQIIQWQAGELQKELFKTTGQLYPFKHLAGFIESYFDEASSSESENIITLVKKSNGNSAYIRESIEYPSERAIAVSVEKMLKNIRIDDRNEKEAYTSALERVYVATRAALFMSFQ